MANSDGELKGLDTPNVSSRPSASEASTNNAESDALSIKAADAQLAALGYKAELKRTHTFWSTLAMQTTILTPWSCNIVLYSTIFTLGGPSTLLYTTLIVGIFQTLLMASLAEYAALWPQASGQQFFTQKLAPEKWRRFLSYVVGWCVLIAEISTSSSCAVNSAQVMEAFVQMRYDVDWKSWMTFCVYVLFFLGPVITNMMPGSVPRLSLYGGIFNVVGFLIWMAVFLALAPKNSADFVFTRFLNTSGWSSDGWVFVLALYVPLYGLYGSDCTMHFVEEMKRPARDGPRVMVWSMVLSTAIAFISALVMGFTTGNWEEEMAMTLPYFTWFINVTNSLTGGGVFCALINMGLNYLIILHTNTAASRLIWRMSLDSGFPFSTYFSSISPRFSTPIRATFAVIFLNILAGTLILGTDLAFWALISGGGITLQIAYSVPIICVLSRGRDVLPPRPDFDLGKWGWLVNVLSVGWAALTVLVYAFPQYLPVTGNSVEDMNWAVAIFGTCVLACRVYWGISGRKNYLIGRQEEMVVAREDGP